MPLLTEHSVIQKKENVVCEELGPDAVLLNLQTGDYYTLNDTGRAVWNFLATPASVQALVELTVEKFSIDRCRAEKDVRVFIEELIRMDLCSCE